MLGLILFALLSYLRKAARKYTKLLDVQNRERFYCHFELLHKGEHESSYLAQLYRVLTAVSLPQSVVTPLTVEWKDYGV